MAITLEQLDGTLAAIWSGYTVTTVDRGDVVVPVFVEEPDPEDYPERVIPSIALKFDGLDPDFKVIHSDDYDEINVDTGTVPYQITERRRSAWYRAQYVLHTWAADAQADRQMVRWVESRMLPRDAVFIDGTGYNVFREGFAVVDEDSHGKTLYHKVWVITALVDIDNSDTDQITPAVHEIRLRTGVVKTLPQIGGVLVPRDEAGQVVEASNAEFYPDRTIAFDDTDFWIP